MRPSSPHDPKAPSSKRLGRMGLLAVIIVLAVALIIFVGRNLWYLEETKHNGEPRAQETRQAS